MSERPMTRPETAEQVGKSIRDACDRLDRLYRVLSVPGEVTATIWPDDSPPPFKAIRAGAAILERRIATETLIYSTLFSGDDMPRPGLLPLRHWQFLAGQAVDMADAAEVALTDDLKDASGCVLTLAIGFLSHVTMEVAGETEAPKPSGPRKRASTKH